MDSSKITSTSAVTRTVVRVVWGPLLLEKPKELGISSYYGTPLQDSCLENPMDGGTWWAAVHGVATEWLPFHFSLSCIGEGNGNPLQCSCLENPRDGGAWWAAVYGVAQSRKRLKRLSSSGTHPAIHSPKFGLQCRLWAKLGKYPGKRH